LSRADESVGEKGEPESNSSTIDTGKRQMMARSDERGNPVNGQTRCGSDGVSEGTRTEINSSTIDNGKDLGRRERRTRINSSTVDTGS